MAGGFFSNNFLCKLMSLGKHSRGNKRENHENPHFHGKLDFFTISSYMLSSNKKRCRSRFSYLNERRALFQFKTVEFWRAMVVSESSDLAFKIMKITVLMENIKFSLTHLTCFLSTKTALDSVSCF